MLRQERLAKEYNVSLSPVREALIQLEAEGLLTLVRHRGYAVTTLSIDEIQQLYELRSLLEVALLEHAIPKLEDTDLAAAAKAHDAMKKISERGTQTAAWTKINWEFHTSLYKPAGKNQLLSAVNSAYASINLCVHTQRKLHNSVDLARNIEEHGMLLAYAESREVDKAAQLLRKHIVEAGSDLIGFLQQNRNPAKSPHSDKP